MSTALRNAATGMLAAQLQTDVLAHNIANSQTAGYKQENPLFATAGYENKMSSGTASSSSGSLFPIGIQVGLGVQVAGVTKTLTQGPGTNSDNPNHIMIQGNGYFQIELPSGEIAYTRDGTFERNATGELVTKEGFMLVPGITIPTFALSIEINKNGEVFAKIAGQTAPQALGQIELASFTNPAGLEAIGSNLLLETQSSGAPVVGTPSSEGFGSLKHRWYENSNVNSVAAITELIESQRLFEFNTKVVKAAEEMSRAELSVFG